MSGKQNCWEFKQCGRAVGGDKTSELGVCPASEDTSSDGVNGGRNGGRICWAISGTLCGDEVQGSFAQKEKNCMNCDFFKRVRQEEGSHFKILKPGQRRERTPA